jgi:predicted ATPase/class 3 adenylate cyclase
MPELPTGTVTFLFTDLEGSTRLWDEHPDTMRDALARHDAILRDAVESQHGAIVKSTGDGIHAVFASAHDAVGAAVTAQRALGTESWSVPSPIKVRMGLHTGEAEHRDGDYYGTATNRAARIMSVAHGGQVLVTLSTEELLSDSLPDGVTLRDLGEHRLRDLSRPDRVFQISASGLREDFPPIRSLDAYPGNLPVQLTSFVGRHQELVALGKLLREARLVTITGTGGVGKTRLSVQLAAEVLQRFPDGAWLCELAAASDDEAMAQVVAAALGALAGADADIDERIVEYLRNKQALVVLDNCEHLLGAVARLADAILRRCPGVCLVATSREGLGIEGERVWPLRSLPLPDTSRSGMEAEESDALRLFAERAAAASPDFELDATTVTAVADICRRLDGIPLAIELAAARAVSMSPSQISTRLDERFRLLTGGRRTAVERHQTLRAAVDWSFSLLDERTQTVFNRLGVFAGSFDDEAAEAVATGDGIEEWDVVDALGELVAKSMVLAERDGSSTRYQLLETMRAYARERLEESGEADAWRRRHAAHYAAFADLASPALRGPDELAWRTRLSQELDNLRAAVTWGLDAEADDDAELGLRIIAALGWEAVLDRATGVGAWARRAVERAQRSPAETRAAVLGAAALDFAFSGDQDAARPLALAVLERGEPPNCPSPGAALAALSIADAYSGDADRALQRVLETQTEYESRGDPWLTAALFVLGAGWACVSNDGDNARRLGREAVRLARSSGNPSMLASALMQFGRAMQEEDPSAALAAFDESVELTHAGASSGSMTTVLAQAAPLMARAGNTPRALEALREAIVHSHEVVDRISMGQAVTRGAVTFALVGHFEPVAVLDGAMHANVTGGHILVTEQEAEEEVAASAQAREVLGPDEYEGLQTRGTRMSYEELVEYLIGELDGLIAQVDGA